MKRNIKNLASAFIVTGALLFTPMIARATEIVYLPVIINGAQQFLEAHQRLQTRPHFEDYTSSVRVYNTDQDAQIAAIRASKTTTDTVLLSVEWGDLYATDASAIGYTKHLKSGEIPCVRMTARVDNLVLTGTGCYTAGQAIDTTNPDDTYNDTYLLIDQMANLYNPNPHLWTVIKP